MLTVDEIRQAAQELGAQYGVEHIYLFGSYARGEATADSDVDLRLDKGQLRGLFQLAGLQLALEDRLGAKVDLLPAAGDSALCIERRYGGERLVALYNFSDWPVPALPGESGAFTDLWTGNRVQAEGLTVPGNGFRWLACEE